jgi:hypothetical protein
MKIQLFYATNRKHLGPDRWRPTGYGTKFSDDGVENLRFGRLTLDAADAAVRKRLAADGAGGPGDGEGLADLLSESAGSADIRAYEEKIEPGTSDATQPNAVLGSLAMFRDLKAAMEKGADVLTFIHGFNVSWEEAVGSAAALQLMLNRPLPKGVSRRPVIVLVFTWPSDGLALPFVSYKSDRSEAQGSGYAVGRGFLKLRDFLTKVRQDGAAEGAPCNGGLHLLCHSMGNYVLQCALERLRAFTPGTVLPRVFDRIFLSAADVDDNVLEPGAPLGDLHELARGVSVYYNRGDVAMYVSDYTKGNPERLGTNGAARPTLVHAKAEQVDCSEVVGGFVEHSYHLSGLPNRDVQLSIYGMPPLGKGRARRKSDVPGNVWTLRP